MSANNGSTKNPKEAYSYSALLKSGNNKKAVNLNQSLDNVRPNSKQVNKIVENLTTQNELLKESLDKVEKEFFEAKKTANTSLNIQLALKNELEKYKAIVINQNKSKKPIPQEHHHHDKKSEHVIKELEAKLENQQRIMSVLKLELIEKSKFFAVANEQNIKCIKDKTKLDGENLAWKEKVESEQVYKIQALEEVIKQTQHELADAKKNNDALANHIHGLDARVSEIPKLQNKIRMMESQGFAARNNSTGFNSSASSPRNCMPRDIPNNDMNAKVDDMIEKMNGIATEVSILKAMAWKSKQ